MKQTCTRAAMFAALLALAGSVQAQVDRDRNGDVDRPILDATRENWPMELTRRPLTLAQGMVEIFAPLNINMSDGREGDTLTSNPSIYFGVSDRWMVGVRHAVGVCWRDEPAGCDKFYNDVSFDTLLSLGRASGIDIAVGGAVNVAPIDPATWHGEVRLVARAGGGALALTVAPTVNFGFNDRDSRTKFAAVPTNLASYNLYTVEALFAQNKEFLAIPATLQLQVGRSLALAVNVSYDNFFNADDVVDGGLDEAGLGNGYRIPVTFAAVLTPIANIDVGANFTFLNLLGENDNSDLRTLGVFAALRI
jgi:hypothetical protein